jgi:hypothetical protein
MAAKQGGKKLEWIETEKGCFECTSHKANRTHKGSGYKSIRIRKNGVLVYLHRFIFEEMHGPIPEGLIIRHKCDNGFCINPEHMELGTQKDNVHDMLKRGRANCFGRMKKKKGAKS